MLTSPIWKRSGRSNGTGLRYMKGEVYRLPARGGHEQQGRRFAVVLQPDRLALSTWIIAFTSTSARRTSFRPVVNSSRNNRRLSCATSPITICAVSPIRSGF